VGLNVCVIGTEQFFNSFDRQRFNVNTEPVAAITSGDAKFSLAINCKPVACRDRSASSNPKIAVS
jgi:hypothetical protein